MKSAILVIVSVVTFIAMVPSAVAIAALPPGSYDYYAHDPIDIRGDSQIAGSSGVVRGSGTPIDPFVIATWNIVPSNTYGTGTAIQVYNTTAHVVIEFVHVQDGRYGILLVNATNVTVRDCWITENEFGVDLEECTQCKVTNNSFWDNQRAIRQFECQGLVIWNNSFERNSADMIIGTPAGIIWWVVVLSVVLGSVLVALLYVMRRSYSARKKPTIRVGARLTACALIQVVSLYQLGPYLSWQFGNGAIGWNSYVLWTGTVTLLALIGSVFVLVFRSKWMEHRLP